MQLATVGNGKAIHIAQIDHLSEATLSDGRVIPARTRRDTACGASEINGNALYGHRRNKVNDFEGSAEDVTCKRCLKSAAAKKAAAEAEQPAAAPAPVEAPAEPTIEELEAELAAATKAEDAAVESDAAPEVMRSARARFVAAHDALQDARREQHRRDRGYAEAAEAPAEETAKAEAPAANIQTILEQALETLNAAYYAARAAGEQVREFTKSAEGQGLGAQTAGDMRIAAQRSENCAREARNEADDALSAYITRNF